MRTIDTFDPSVSASGQITTQTVNPCSVVVLFNHSLNGLTLTMPNGDTANLPPWYFRYYYMAMPGNIQWVTSFQLTSSGAPVSKVTGEVYEPSEAENRTFTEGPLPLQTNVGNVVSTSMGGSTSLQNDGNVASTVWAEATQSGGPASNVSATVDGSIQFNQWDGTTKKLLFQTIANAAVNNPSIKALAAGMFMEIVGSLLVDQNLILANNTAMQIKDSLGTARTVMQVDASNNLQLFGITGTDKAQLLSSGGTLAAVFDLVNKVLNVKGTDQTKNGSTSGTWDVYEVISSDFLKIVTYWYNNYKNAGSANTVALKTPFTKGGMIIQWGAQGLNLLASGVAQNIFILTALPASGGAAGTTSVTTAISQNAMGQFNGAIDTLKEPGGNAATITGFGMIIGV